LEKSATNKSDQIKRVRGNSEEDLKKEDKKMRNLIKITVSLILLFVVSTPVTADEKKTEPIQPKLAPLAVKGPDLVVRKIVCGPGNKLQFHVANVGTGPLRPGWVGKSHVWINGRTLFDSIDLKNATATTGGGIERPGGTSIYTTPYNIVSVVTVKVETDYGNYIRESNEGNNTMTTTIQPCERAALPDLTVIGFSHDDRVYVLMVTIKNLGPGTVPPTTRGTLQVFVEGGLVDTINLDSIVVPSYPGQDFHKPGEASVVGTRWHFPPSKDFRRYNVCAVIDATNVITETNEANNRFCRMEQCPPH
jgi:hypothetical protein